MSPEERIESKGKEKAAEDKPEVPTPRVRKYIRHARVEAPKETAAPGEMRPEPEKVKPKAEETRPEPTQVKTEPVKTVPEQSAVKPATRPPEDKRPEKVERGTIRPKQPSERRRVQFGEPIDFRGVRFAPVNKQGVLHMFGTVSRELGFLIEAILYGISGL